MTDTNKVNQIYQKHKNNFIGQFHSVLWKLLVDKVKDYQPKQWAFVSNITNVGYVLGLAEKNHKGYLNTGVYFKTNKHDKVENICDDLNTTVFELEPKEAMKIVLSSL